MQRFSFRNIFLVLLGILVYTGYARGQCVNPITLGGLSSTTASVNVPFSATFNVNGGDGGTYSYTKDGAWPANWDLNGNEIIGTPTLQEDGTTVQLSVIVDDGGDCIASEQYLIDVSCPTISTSSVALGSTTATVGVAFDQAISGASGGTAPYTYALESPVPTGWSIANNRLQGIPASSNSLAFIVKATDNNGCQSATKTLSLNPTCPTISTSSIALSSSTATVGVAFDQSISGASGGTSPYTYTLETPVTGWSIASSRLQGIPASSSSLAFIVKATDNNGCQSATKTLTLNPTCPKISTSSIALSSSTATVGVAFDQPISGASGGTSP